MEESSDYINGNEVFDSKLRLFENPHWVPKEQNIGEFLMKHMKRNEIKIALVSLIMKVLVLYSLSQKWKMKRSDVIGNDDKCGYSILMVEKLLQCVQ